MLCDNLLEEGERTRIARICTDFLLNRLNLCEGEVGVGVQSFALIFFGVGGGSVGGGGDLFVYLWSVN